MVTTSDDFSSEPYFIGFVLFVNFGICSGVPDIPDSVNFAEYCKLSAGSIIKEKLYETSNN